MLAHFPTPTHIFSSLMSHESNTKPKLSVSVTCPSGNNEWSAIDTTVVSNLVLFSAFTPCKH